jgi:hypothetical protein
MAISTCHWHPDRQTGLRCSRCDKSVCVECMRQHPVGIRCKECELELRISPYQISTSYYAKGIGAAAVLGLGGLLALLLILSIFPAAGFFFFILMGGLGYGIGEGVGYAVNRRRGRPYQYMALGGVLLATAPIAIGSIFVLSMGAAFNLLGVGMAALVAWERRKL